MSTPARISAGVPDGGRFAPLGRTEPDVDLNADAPDEQSVVDEVVLRAVPDAVSWSVGTEEWDNGYFYAPDELYAKKADGTRVHIDVTDDERICLEDTLTEMSEEDGPLGRNSTYDADINSSPAGAATGDAVASPAPAHGTEAAVTPHPDQLAAERSAREKAVGDLVLQAPADRAAGRVSSNGADAGPLPDAEDLWSGGEMTPADFLGRVLLALAITPADEGRFAVETVGRGGGVIVECSRPVGYLQDRLTELHHLAQYALSRGRTEIFWS